MNKQKRSEELQDFYLDGLSLDEVIETCNQVKATYGDNYSHIWVDVHIYDDYGSPSCDITFRGTREETEEEALARETQEEKYAKTRRAAEKIQYEALKKKFEGIDV